MKKTLLLFILLLTVNYCFAQNNYKAAYIITNENDTIHGFVDYRIDELNGQECKFKSSKDTAPILYTPNNIAGFRITENGKYFIAYDIKINSQKKKVFLEYMVKGKMNLYYYYEYPQGYYFMESENGEMLTLTKKADELKRFQNATNNSSDFINVEDTKYDGIIRYTFKDYPEIAEKKDKIKFTQKSMIDIAKTYHNLVCETGEECIIFENENPDNRGIKTQFSLYGGLMYFSYQNLISGSNLVPIKTFSPVIGGQINFYNQRLSQYLSLQFDFSIAKVNKTTDDLLLHSEAGLSYYRKSDFDLYPLSLRAGLKYTYRNKGKIQPTAEAGVMYTHLFGDLTRYFGMQSDDNPINYAQSTNILRSRHLGYYIALGADYVLNNDQIIFIRVAMENYQKKDPTAEFMTRENYIRTPHVKIGYTF